MGNHSSYSYPEFPFFTRQIGFLERQDPQDPGAGGGVLLQNCRAAI